MIDNFEDGFESESSDLKETDNIENIGTVEETGSIEETESIGTVENGINIGDIINNSGNILIENNVDLQTEEIEELYEQAKIEELNKEKEAIDIKIEELREKEAEMAKDIVREREIRDNMILGDNPVSPDIAKRDADTIYDMGESIEEKRIDLIQLDEEIKSYGSVSSQIGILNQLEEKIASSGNPEQIAHYREMQEKLKTRIEKSKLDIELRMSRFTV